MMDLSAYKSLKVGGIELVRLVIGGVLAWARKTFSNLVPLSTDTDGSIFNSVGYKDNVRLSSSGGISGSAQNGSTTTGFIPWGGDTDILRLKGVDWVHETGGKHYYINFYNSSKGFLNNYIEAQTQANGGYDHILTVYRENGVTTFVWNTDYGTSNVLLQSVRQAKFIRITAKGKGADMIVTINEEI